MKNKHGMKSPTMPKEHFEMKADELNVSKIKYASKDTMDNPKDLERANDGLAQYVRKHKMKY